MGEKAKLYIDMDNTIINSVKAICDMYNEDYQYYPNYKYIHWTDIHTYDFKECTCAKTKALKKYFTYGRFFNCVNFMDNAHGVLYRLQKKYQIAIVSIGTAANLRAKKIWIKDRLAFADFIGVNVDEYADKSHIDMSDGILIDDDARYLESSNTSTKICFGDVYEWNESWTGKRCCNWIELEEYLKEMQEAEER